MQLKEFQSDVLERMGVYLSTLKRTRADVMDFVEYQRARGREVKAENWCKKAWEALDAGGAIPYLHLKKGGREHAPWIDRSDGLKRPIPNVCLKVPTAGGKTLLATAAVERINVDFFERQTGFVLWVVPSDAIYRQTWRALANREHSYRQWLERASGGRVKVLEKGDNFEPEDVQSYLCVMLLMLQSSARQGKETLRVFRDSGKFTRFFPPVDDHDANAALLARVPNLDRNDVGEIGPIEGLSVRHSLGNALRMVEPIIVIDEGHRAYSETARGTLCGFNPRFILELSATPNDREHHSNVLVDVPGSALKREQMIKMPIVITNDENSDWKHTLAAAKDELDALEQEARRVQEREDRYIRPILLVRVERTGNDQRDDLHIHAEDVREHLMHRLGVAAEAVRVKSASLDEIQDEDLLSRTSPVRFIITKDALREGWDCPFAYVLAILSKTTASTAMTQMVGRILRQPEARDTGSEALNQCYVFCFDQEVEVAIQGVRKGLEEEGMADLAAEVRMARGGQDVNADEVEVIKIGWSPLFKGDRIILPRVLHREGNGWRVLEYERDILAELDWDAFSYRGADTFEPSATERLERTRVRVDLGKVGKPETEELQIDDESRLDFAYLVRQLTDVIPNPWQGARILGETLDVLKRRKVAADALIASRLFLVQEIRRDLEEQINAAAEVLFAKKVEEGSITFRLVVGDESLNWEMAEEYEFTASDNERWLKRKNNQPLQRSLFEKEPSREFNDLEKPVALYLDAHEAVHWWHRIAVHRDYSLQGWRRNKVYPDFVACLKVDADGNQRMLVLETKGEHLSGNVDTKYKQRLLDILSDADQTPVTIGQMEFGEEGHKVLTLRMLFESSWEIELPGLIGVS